MKSESAPLNREPTGPTPGALESTPVFPLGLPENCENTLTVFVPSGVDCIKIMKDGKQISLQI
jgi:hypothetical protein